jgi:hypothetical protein
MENFPCACGKPVDKSKIQRLVFYNSIVDILYELDDKFRNPDNEETPLHLEAKFRDVVILGNA